MTTGEIWIPEFQKLSARGSSNSMARNHGSKKVTHHTTEAPSGHTKSGNSYFDAMHRVLRDAKSEPHILIDPLTDEAGQYFPLNRSARALRGVNKDGTINIQIEWVGYASKPFTDYWRPGPNVRALMRAIRSWGIPDEFAGGLLMRSYGDPRTSRSMSNWRKSGHFGHCQAPGNSHWDPGAISTTKLLAVGRTATPAPAPKETFLMGLNDKQQTELYDRVTAIWKAGTGLTEGQEKQLNELARTVPSTHKHVETLVRDLTFESGLSRRIQRNIEQQNGANGERLVNLAQRTVTVDQIVRAVDGLGIPEGVVDELAKRLAAAVTVVVTPVEDKGPATPEQEKKALES